MTVKDKTKEFWDEHTKVNLVVSNEAELQKPMVEQGIDGAEVMDGVEDVEKEKLSKSSPKKRGMSEENRRRAGERMREMMLRKKMEKEEKRKQAA